MLVSLLMFTSCGNSNGIAENNLERGSFKATVGKKQYEIDVVCSHHNTSYFKFRSVDKDGQTVTGVEMNRKLILSIDDNGKRYSTKNVATWEKNRDGVTGSGILYNEAVATDSRSTTFTLTCR